MKKVLSALILTSLFAVLLVPIAASAENCPNWNCEGSVNTVPCVCGNNAAITDSSYYCWGGGNNGAGRAFSSQSACQAAMSGGVGTTQGLQTAPTLITSVGGLLTLITNIGNIIFSILLGIAAIMLILAGFYWVTAGGNAENVKKASDMLRNALIGVAVALGAKGLVLVISSIMSG